MVDKTPQPLGNQFPIVDQDGKPTMFMTRWAAQRQLGIQDSITSDEATQIADIEATTIVDAALHSHSVTAGTGLSGGGTLDTNPSLSISADVGQLLDVDTTTTPPTSGQALAWNGTKWVPTTISGGGGGSGGSSGIFTSWSNTPTSSIANGPVPDCQLAFTLTEETTVRVEFGVQFRRDGSGEARFHLFDGTTLLVPVPPESDAGTPRWGGLRYTTTDPEGRFFSCEGSYVVTLEAGPHTLILNWEDADAVSGTQFYYRNITATQVTNTFTPAGGGGGSGNSAFWSWSQFGVDSPVNVPVTVSGSYSGSPQTAMGFSQVNNWYWNNGTTVGIVQFDFGTAVILEGFGFFQDVPADQGTWQAAGSNDGSTWTNLGSPGPWGPTAGFTGFSFTNSTAYRYYRLTQASGSTQNAAYQQLFMFKWRG